MGRIPWPVKWILAPAAAAGLGYFVLGPQLAGNRVFANAVKAGAERVVPKTESDAPAPEGGESALGDSASPNAPQVRVDVKPIGE